jgi:hypothetical protein
LDLLTKLVTEAPAWPHTTAPAAIQREAVIRDLKAAIPIRIQNVADYLFLETDQEYFELNKDFPNLAPPWPVFFMSYKMPSRFRSGNEWKPNAGAGAECGVLFAADELGPTNGWSVRSIFWCVGARMTVVRSVIWRISPAGECLSADGTRPSNERMLYNMSPIFRWPTGEKIMQAPMELQPFFAPLLAVSFCHCKNVDILHELVPPKVKAKRERAHGWSPEAWHALKIEPMRKQLRGAGAGERGGLKRALHICRGHFKDYREGRGLFGKVHGMWWWDSRLTDSSHRHHYEMDKPHDSPERD